MWKTEYVVTAFNAFHATEGSNYLGLTVADLVFGSFIERENTHRILLGDFFKKIKKTVYT